MATAKLYRSRAPLNDKVPGEVRAAVDNLGLVDFAWARALYTEQDVQWAVKRELAEWEKHSASADEGKKGKKAAAFLSRKDQTNSAKAPHARRQSSAASRKNIISKIRKDKEKDRDISDGQDDVGAAPLFALSTIQSSTWSTFVLIILRLACFILLLLFAILLLSPSCRRLRYGFGGLSPGDLLAYGRRSC